MDHFSWSDLRPLQLARYAEYLVKMEFTRLGISVFSAEVDDQGIDFVLRKDSREYYDVQVKSVLKSDYVFISKSKRPTDLPANFLVALALFEDGSNPDLYLVPATEWRTQNDLFVDREYKEKKSKPEYGLKLSAKSRPLLNLYRLEAMVNKIGLASAPRS